MSTGFLVKFVNSTALTVKNISAKAESEGDWEAPSVSPDEVIKGSIPSASSSAGFHLERHSNRRHCPFTVKLELSDGNNIEFTLDGKTAIDNDGNGRVKTSDSTGKMGVFQLIVPAGDIGGSNSWNGMTIFITKDVWSA
jgi:hypothetical protein